MKEKLSGRLGELCTIKIGTKPLNKPNEVSRLFAYINAGLEPSGYCENSNSTGGAITIPSRGYGGAGYVGFQQNDFWCGPLCYKMYSISEDNLTRYFYFYLTSIQENIIILRKTGSIPAVNRGDLLSIKVPVPPLKEQQRIVDILDRFDTLCNDISSGLPSEIKLRQKQYEHYRDKLLTFKKLEVEV